MKVLIDMNLSPRWVRFLSEAGFDTVHWSAVGRYDAPDVEIMEYAASHEYIVLTHDLDFGAILAATQGNKPSVIQVRASDISPTAIARQVISALHQMRVELFEGALLSIDLHRTRLRLLPLGRKGDH